MDNPRRSISWSLDIIWEILAACIVSCSFKSHSLPADAFSGIVVYEIPVAVGPPGEFPRSSSSWSMQELSSVSVDEIELIPWLACASDIPEIIIHMIRIKKDRPRGRIVAYVAVYRSSLYFYESVQITDVGGRWGECDAAFYFPEEGQAGLEVVPRDWQERLVCVEESNLSTAYWGRRRLEDYVPFWGACIRPCYDIIVCVFVDIIVFPWLYCHFVVCPSGTLDSEGLIVGPGGYCSRWIRSMEVRVALWDDSS